MKAAFIGISKASISLAYTLKTLRKNNPDCPICVSGIFCTNINSAVNAAISLNVKAYLKFEDAVKDADIIFFSTTDNNISELVETIRENKIRHKILCHFSKNYSSDILCCGSTNTYVSMYMPYCETDRGICDLSNSVILFEGTGRDFDNFTNCLINTGECFRKCTTKEKHMAVLASRFASEYTLMITEYAEKLYRFSGSYEKDNFEKLLKNALISASKDKPLQKRKISGKSVHTDIKLLNELGISELKEIYKPLEYASVVKSIKDMDEAEKIKSYIRKIR